MWRFDQETNTLIRSVSSAAQILEGYFRQAGMDRIAGFIRPSMARINGRLDDDPLPEMDA